MRSGAVAGDPFASLTNRQMASYIRASLAPRLSKLYLPKHVCVVDEFPRTGIGKIDRVALERRYDQRIEVARVTLHRIRLPFKTPFKTAKITLTHRESIIVEVTDHAGRTGLGECVAFPTDWYLPETLDQDVRILHDVLAPIVLREAFLHPSEASAAFASLPEAKAFPLACGAPRAGAVGPVRQDRRQTVVAADRRGCGAPRGPPGARARHPPCRPARRSGWAPRWRRWLRPGAAPRQATSA